MGLHDDVNKELPINIQLAYDMQQIILNTKDNNNNFDTLMN